MNKYLLCFLFAMYLIACGGDEKKIPKDILPINQMKFIVWDLIQSGEYAKSFIEKDTSKKNINTAYLAAALKLHKISKEDFFKSFNYYQAHPLLNQELFDSITSYAQRQRNGMYKKRH